MEYTNNTDITVIIADILANTENTENFYNILMLQAITKEDKMILQEIIDDNHMHTTILKEIYQNLTSKSRYENKLYTLDTPDTRYVSNLQNALLQNFNNIDKYKILHSNMNIENHKNSIFNILIDELKNSSKLNLLIVRNI